MRVLNLDIEMAPAMVYVWDLRTRYVTPEKVIHPKRLLCFAGKWVTEEDVYFFSSWDDGPDRMVRQIWDLLDEADAVLHYNGRRFDIPQLNTEFVRLGLTPPSPYGQIDLYKAVTRSFSFMSNSLDSVSKELGTAHKLTHGGFSLWTRVLDGDEQAQREMEDYNVGDVFANEDLYERILPWIPSHPNYQLMNGSGCSQCGSLNVEEKGVAYTAVSAFPRYLCGDCGMWMRGSRRVSGVELRGVSS